MLRCVLEPTKITSDRREERTPSSLTRGAFDLRKGPNEIHRVVEQSDDLQTIANPRRTYCSQTGRMGLAGMPWVVPVGTSRISVLALGVHSTAQPPLGCITKSVANNRGSVLGWKSCTLAPPSTSL